MQKATLLLCLLWTAVAGWAAPRTFTLSSPDRNYEFTLAVEEDAGGATRLYYTLTYKGKTVVGKSRLGVDIENKLLESALGIENDSCAQWGDNLSYIGSETGESQRTWQPLYGERSNITDHYRSLRVKFRKGEAPAEEAKDGYDRSRTYFMDVEARAYNEGVAFRYHFPATTNGLFLHITRELTEFALPEGTLAYYEAWAQSPVEPRLLNGWEGESERPLTMILKNGLTVALGEARMRDYVRTKFALSPERRNTLVTSMYDCADVITPYDTPWRVVMAAERPVELIAHDYLYLNLNDNYGNELFPTVCHEGYPGHLYQTTYFYSQDPNPLRCALAFTGYSEGWASYVEEMSYDYSGMSEDVSQFIAANYALSMCIYAYVDIGIHYNGWDKEQTSQFLSQYLVLDDETLTQIYETVLFSPGNYLNYCIGSLEIQDLRQTAEDTLDDAFDEKAFHQFILDMGPAPFSIIENHMQDWFAAMTD